MTSSRVPQARPVKQKGKRKTIIALVASNIVVAIAVIAMVIFWLLNPSYESTYANGVARVNELTMKPNLIVLNSLHTKDNKMVVSAGLEYKNNEFSPVVLKRSLNEDVEYVYLQDYSNEDVIENPHQLICDIDADIDCKNLSELPSEITIRNTEFTRNKDNSTWTTNNVAFDTDYIIDVDNDVVIGGDWFDDNEEPSNPSQQRFSQLKIFDKSNGDLKSYYDLDTPSYVTRTTEGINILETSPDVNTVESIDDVERIIDQSKDTDLRNYFLVPSNENNRVDSTDAPSKSEGKAEQSQIRKDEIKNFDFLNRPVYDGTGIDYESCPVRNGDTIPDSAGGCWLPNSEGKATSAGQCSSIINIDESAIDFDDYSGDGYLDAHTYAFVECHCVTMPPIHIFWIFDPNDPEHPFMYSGFFGGTDDPARDVVNEGGGKIRFPMHMYEDGIVTFTHTDNGITADTAER